jgi:hypothetical protein
VVVGHLSMFLEMRDSRLIVKPNSVSSWVMHMKSLVIDCGI